MGLNRTYVLMKVLGIFSRKSILSSAFDISNTQFAVELVGVKGRQFSNTLKFVYYSFCPVILR